MEFIKNIGRSIYSPSFYGSLNTRPFSFSIKYFLLFLLIVALVATILLSIVIVPAFKSLINDIAPKIIDYYPQDLTVTIKNGQVSTNVQEPYFIKIPDELKDKEAPSENMPQIENAIAIDTTKPFSLEEFQSYKTFALLTKDALVSYKKDGITIQPLEKNTNFEINKVAISNLYTKAKPYLDIIYFTIPFIVIACFVLFTAYQLIYMFLGALIIWLACKIKGISVKYFKAYQFGLHLLTPIILLELIFMFFRIQTNIPFTFTIILFILALLNINKQKDEPKTNT